MAAVALVTAALALTWLADWRLRAVTTGSMAPAIAQGSLAVVEPVAPYAAHEGDVIVFRDPTDRGRQVMHRVTARVEQTDGRLLFRTHGDANLTPDPLLVASTDLVGRVRWHMPHLGSVVQHLQPPLGPALFAGVALLTLTARTPRRPRPVDRRRFDILPAVTDPPFVL